MNSPLLFQGSSQCRRLHDPSLAMDPLSRFWSSLGDPTHSPGKEFRGEVVRATRGSWRQREHSGLATRQEVSFWGGHVSHGRQWPLMLILKGNALALNNIITILVLEYIPPHGTSKHASFSPSFGWPKMIFSQKGQIWCNINIIIVRI